MKIFLSAKHKITASGLYYYEHIPGTKNYRQFIIDYEGRPQPHPAPSDGINIIQNLIVDHQPTLNCKEFAIGDWIAMPNSKPPAFLALVKPYVGWMPTVRCQLRKRGQHYYLPKSVYRHHLIQVLWNLYNDSYQQIKNAFTAGDIRGSISAMGPFWEMIASVGQDMIARVGETFRDSKYKDALNNPDWAFQLIRIMTQGFFEGHATYFSKASGSTALSLEIANYPVQSVASWGESLDLVEQGFTLEQLEAHSQSNPRLQQKKEALYVLLFGEEIGQRIATSNSPLLEEFSEWWIELITPGITEEEEFAFWSVHDPHYLVDMTQALHEHGKRDVDVSENKTDWDKFEETILKNFPTKGRHIYLWDRVMALAMRQAVNFNPDGRLNPRNFMVGRIFEHARRQVP